MSTYKPYSTEYRCVCMGLYLHVQEEHVYFREQLCVCV